VKQKIKDVLSFSRRDFKVIATGKIPLDAYYESRLKGSKNYIILNDEECYIENISIKIKTDIRVGDTVQLKLHPEYCEWTKINV
jgi:hypothetical protein